MSRGDVLALLLCMTCAASVAGLATIVASPGPASPRFPLRLKGGGAKPQVSRCESGNAAGGTNIVESAEMAGDRAQYFFPSRCVHVRRVRRVTLEQNAIVSTQPLSPDHHD